MPLPFGRVSPQALTGTPASFPAVQWVNGNPSWPDLQDFQATGGFALPVKNVAPGTQIPDWAIKTVMFRRAREACLLARQADLAVLHTRFRWEAQEGGWVCGYPRPAYNDLNQRGVHAR
jgi:hypothetical protein